jgi:hypothetical protein
MTSCFFLNFNTRLNFGSGMLLGRRPVSAPIWAPLESLASPDAGDALTSHLECSRTQSSKAGQGEDGTLGESAQALSPSPLHAPGIIKKCPILQTQAATVLIDSQALVFIVLSILIKREDQRTSTLSQEVRIH